MPLFDVSYTYTIQVQVINQFEANSEEEAIQQMQAASKSGICDAEVKPSMPYCVGEFYASLDKDSGKFNILEF